MNSELEDSDAVATFRRTSVMVDSRGLTDCITIEYIVSTFEDGLLDGVLVRFVDGEYEGKDTVATVRIEQGVTIDTGLGVSLTAEVISFAFADSSMDGVEHLLKHVDLQSEEVFLSVHSRIVAEEACVVVFLGLSVPTVGPYERQVISTNVSDGIYQRVNGELEHGGAIATLRSQCTVDNRLRLTDRISVEDHITAFEDVLLNEVVVRFVNGEDQGNDAIATVRRHHSITIDTCLGVGITAEVIACTLAHRVTDSVLDRIVNDELQAVVHRFTVYHGRIVAIEACCIE